ncbi:PIG-L family deacetylase [Actinomadura oligospora]|uniref:PIG-L family deacetylase n=1 Tax=Actinomadura oligospora TaxID=111804 RepID=UPI00047CBB03|nr:PIG-L family deacetylase [Actinomadura oligospora]
MKRGIRAAEAILALGAVGAMSSLVVTFPEGRSTHTGARGKVADRAGRAFVDGVRPPGGKETSAPTPTGTATGHWPGPGGRFMQFVAHQDDDSLFYYPDMIRSRAADSTTVYLTSGEATGRQFKNRCLYGQHREDGARAAWARNAGLPDRWTRTPLRLPGGQTVELDTLNGASNIRLVFFKLHEAGDRPAMKHTSSLEKLSHGVGAATTLGSEPSDGPNCDPQYVHQRYTRQQFEAGLTWLMQRFGPTVVLAQDPKSPPVQNRFTHVVTTMGDHTDHRGAGRLVSDAAARYAGPGGDGSVLVRYYRDYNIRSSPPNLGTIAPGKKQLFLTYLGAHGANDPGPNPNNPTFYTLFYARQYTRWTNGTNWAVLDGAKRLNAFAVLNGRIAQWQQARPGGPWTGPKYGPGGGLAPNVTAVRDQRGMLHLFALRMSDDAIVTASQKPSGDWTAWWSLGNPDPGAGLTVGAPAVAVTPGGDMTVAVRNLAGGVSVKTRRGGVWADDWTGLSAKGVRDGVAAVADASGRVEVFAPTDTGVARWRQQQPGEPFVPVLGGSGGPPAGPVTAVVDATGAPRIYYPASGAASTVTQSDNGMRPDPLGGPMTFEGTAAAPRGQRTVLAARTNDGALALGVQNAPYGPYAWSTRKADVMGSPALAYDAEGHLVVLAFGGDAHLYTMRSTAPDTATSFTDWTRTG